MEGMSMWTRVSLSFGRGLSGSIPLMGVQFPVETLDVREHTFPVWLLHSDHIVYIKERSNICNLPTIEIGSGVLVCIGS